MKLRNRSNRENLSSVRDPDAMRGTRAKRSLAARRPRDTAEQNEMRQRK